MTLRNEYSTTPDSQLETPAPSPTPNTTIREIPASLHDLKPGSWFKLDEYEDYFIAADPSDSGIRRALELPSGKLRMMSAATRVLPLGPISISIHPKI